MGGRKEGRKEGRKKGRTDGLTKGRKEGRTQRNKERRKERRKIRSKEQKKKGATWKFRRLRAFFDLEKEKCVRGEGRTDGRKRSKKGAGRE
jgi:hypothetical protein